MASLQRLVSATCPMKFNKLNSVRQVAGTKYPPNWCCTIIKVSVYTRGRVAATYPGDMYPQHFHVCANVMILSLLHVPATSPCYMSPQCVLHKFSAAAACCCDMTPCVSSPLCSVRATAGLDAYTRGHLSSLFAESLLSSSTSSPGIQSTIALFTVLYNVWAHFRGFGHIVWLD